MMDLIRTIVWAAVMLQIASWSIDAFSPYERASVVVCEQRGKA